MFFDHTVHAGSFFCLESCFFVMIFLTIDSWTILALLHVYIPRSYHLLACHISLNCRNYLWSGKQILYKDISMVILFGNSRLVCFYVGDFCHFLKVERHLCNTVKRKLWYGKYLCSTNFIEFFFHKVHKCHRFDFCRFDFFVDFFLYFFFLLAFASLDKSDGQ